ncbi:MAG: hypothetical protein WCX79_04390 [Candidatus Paceibacterota bacterium]|jgi:hypothetical protein
MKTINKDQKIDSESEKKTLEVFCSDSIGVKARTTFDSCKIEGVQITYWQDDDNDIDERIDSVFDMLFDEVIKTRILSRKKEIKN